MQLCCCKGKCRKYYIFFVINNRALVDKKDSTVMPKKFNTATAGEPKFDQERYCCA